MAKRIIQQARGKGSSTYRVRRQSFKYRLAYPPRLTGEGTVLKLFNSSAHSCPLAKVKYSEGFFYMPAFKGMIEGQKIEFGGKEIKPGNILNLKNIPLKTSIYNIEVRPNDGGKFVKTAGSSAIVSKIIGNKLFVLMPSKKEIELNENCRAVIGVCAGHGRLEKPFLKAGKKHHLVKSQGGRIWPRTSAIKVNAIDHPFGSGRGKNPKSKIAKRNAPPGARVGLIRPRRTGKKK